jgi:hypothetical protein
MSAGTRTLPLDRRQIIALVVENGDLTQPGPGGARHALLGCDQAAENAAPARWRDGRVGRATVAVCPTTPQSTSEKREIHLSPREEFVCV